MKIRVGSRESKLAVIQSELVIEAIRRHNSDIEIELVTMKTTGDIIQNKTLDKIGGKGLFVKELDQALLEGRVDITVHSFKDMPMEVDKRLPIVAVSKREDPRDALVLPLGVTEIDLSKPIGCASARRKLQLEALYPGCIVEPIRGNVLKRLEKLDNGEFSATTLAVAGLKRLGLTDRISRIFEPKEMLPAACQGVLAVQSRVDFDVSFLLDFCDTLTFQIANAERSFVAALDGGCSSPVAAHGIVLGESLTLCGLYVDEAGVMFKGEIVGNINQGKNLGQELAKRLKKGGKL